MKLCYSDNTILQVLTVLNFLITTINVVIYADETPVTSDQLCNSTNWNKKIWSLCECKPAKNVNEVDISCNRVSWTTIPPFLQPQNSSQKDFVYKTNVLKIKSSNLVSLLQDGFQNLNPRSIDLTDNHISAVNVNAFRFIENRLSEINLNRNQITSIPTLALTHLHQLNHLSLQNNLISEIKPLAFEDTRLEKLRYLHLDYNQISYLSKGSLNNLLLHVLTLSNNKIENIERLALPNTLWYLDLKNNALQQIPYFALADAKWLLTLDLEGNTITKVTASADAEFRKSIDLLLKNNKIELLGYNAFQSFPKLRKLDLSYNQISKISGGVFNSIIELKQLDLSYNQIAFIPERAFENIGKSMQKLNLEDNYLHVLPTAIQDLRTLEVMNLNNNKLTTIRSAAWQNLKPALTELLLAYNRLTEIPTETLNGMKKLQNLDLSKNKITSIKPLQFGGFDGASTTLKKVNLAGNLIERIASAASFGYMNSLTHLDLSYNRLNNLSSNIFLRLENLEILILQGNKLKEFPKSALNGLSKLQLLVLDGNPIHTLPDFALANVESLQHVSISKTKLSSIRTENFHATSTRNLKTLNLAFNQITFISPNVFRGQNKLEELFLHNNQLQTLNTKTFSLMEGLRHLSLANNQIDRINDKAIEKLPKLEQLSLANNQLRSIPRGSFGNLNELKYLDLSNNQLRYFDLSFLQQANIVIEGLDLSHNRIEIVDLTEIKRTLTYLNLASNQFQTIGKGMMHGFGKLQFLDLSDNGIFEIQTNALIKSPKLRFLNLGNNHLRFLKKDTFATQERLDFLSLETNNIDQIEEGTFGSNNVQSLDLSYNKLETIPHHAFVSISNSISSLNLKGNRIKLLDAKCFKRMENLTTLILAYNRIEFIEEGAFSFLKSLIVLDLSNNPVLSWNPQAFKGLSYSIQLLNLAHTGLYSLPKIDKHGLRHFNISGNRISALQSKELDNFKKLETLDISYNKIDELDEKLLEMLTQLKCLNVCGNPIRKIIGRHFKNLNQIEELSICHMTVLYQLPRPNEFFKLRSLQHLQMYDFPHLIDYNPSEILQNLPALQTLDIEIKEPTLNTHFETADLRLLRGLTIRGKTLKKLDPKALTRLRGFKFHLTVKDTSIEEVPNNIFHTLTNINQLSLSIVNNSLKTFKPFLQADIPFVNQHGTILQSLELQEEMLVCDCGLQWIKEWSQHFETTSSAGMRFDGLKCILGSRYGNYEVISYKQFESFQCNRTRKIRYSNVNIFMLILVSLYALTL